MVRSPEVTRGPEITFEAIACWTAIHQIIKIIISASNTWLKMVYLQFTADFLLVYPAVATAIVVRLAHGLPGCLFNHTLSLGKGLAQRLSYESFVFSLKRFVFTDQSCEFSSRAPE